MATFRLRRTDYGATLRDQGVPNGFLVRATGTDPTIVPPTGNFATPTTFDIAEKRGEFELRRPL
jgi:hypothetical protein